MSEPQNVQNNGGENEDHSLQKQDKRFEEKEGKDEEKQGGTEGKGEFENQGNSKTKPEAKYEVYDEGMDKEKQINECPEMNREKNEKVPIGYVKEEKVESLETKRGAKVCDEGIKEKEVGFQEAKQEANEKESDAVNEEQEVGFQEEKQEANKKVSDAVNEEQEVEYVEAKQETNDKVPDEGIKEKKVEGSEDENHGANEKVPDEGTKEEKFEGFQEAKHGTNDKVPDVVSEKQKVEFLEVKTTNEKVLAINVKEENGSQEAKHEENEKVPDAISEEQKVELLETKETNEKLPHEATEEGQLEPQETAKTDSDETLSETPESTEVDYKHSLTSTSSGFLYVNGSLDYGMDERGSGSCISDESYEFEQLACNVLVVPTSVILKELSSQVRTTVPPEYKLEMKGIAPVSHSYNFKHCRFSSVYFQYKHKEDVTKSLRRELLVKRLHPELSMDERLQRYNVFKREVTLYSNTFLDMQKRLTAALGKDTKPFFPRMFPVSALDTLVLEDLRKENYSIKSSRKMLDWAHCVAAIKALARFHAASLAAHYDCPGALERFDELEFVDSKREELILSVETTILAMSREMSLWEGCAPYKDRIERLGHRIVNWLILYTKYGTCHFRALTHGAFWTNNILFHYDGYGYVDDVRFVDYQNTRWAPVILDVLFLLFTSADEVCREQANFSFLLIIYEIELRNTLRKLGLEKLAPRKNQLLYDLDMNIPFAAYAALVQLPLAFIKRKNGFSRLPKMNITTVTGVAYVVSAAEELDDQSVSSPYETDESASSSKAGDSVKSEGFVYSIPVALAKRSKRFQEKLPKILQDLQHLGAI